jgi:hypothetical protein
MYGVFFSFSVFTQHWKEHKNKYQGQDNETDILS